MKKTIVRAVSTAALLSTVFAGSALASTYKVHNGDTLSKIAASHHTSVKDLKAWNGLKSDFLHVNQTLKLSGATPSIQPTLSKTYTVKKGDALIKIANHYHITVGELKRLNKLTTTNIYPGQVLKVAGASNTIKTESVKTTESEKVTTPKNETPKKTTTSTVTTSEYTVKNGDSLSKIAANYKSTVGQLKSLNKLKSDKIRVGQKLKVPGKALAAKPPVQPPKSTTVTNATEYTIKSGDTLGKIASKYGLTLAQLKTLNKLKSDKIYVGKKLKVPGKPVVTKPPVQPPVNKPAPPDKSVSEYIIKSGDTLSKIAAQYGLTTQQLKELNNLTSDQIHVGQKLKVPAEISKTEDSAETLDLSSQLVNAAKGYMGVPYVWGGSTPAGFDCSGFIYQVANKAGISIGRYSAEGYYSRTYYVDKPQAGDLVFFENTYKTGISHVGFYLGDNQFIHADEVHGITITSLDNSYFKQHLDGFKRFY